MNYLRIRWRKNNADRTTGVIFAMFIFAAGLAFGLAAESNAQFCGDVNGSQTVDVSDIVYLMYHLFNGGSPPVSLDSADVDSISGITNHDIQYLIEYIFLGGPVPHCPPYPPDSILPITPDTLEVRNRAVVPFSSQAKVDLWFKSQDDIYAISFAFQYFCATSSIMLDSISFVGTAYHGSIGTEDTVYPGISMGAVGITSNSKLTADSGLVASLWFSITPSADTQFIHIDTTTASPSNITIFSRRTINTGNKLIAFIPTIVGLSPRIVETVTPRQNALNVPPTTAIVARFGYDMDAGTVMETTFVVLGRSSGPHAGIITYNAPTRTATFNPTIDFQSGEVVDVILSTGIHYQGGGPIDSGFVWSFATAARGGTGLFSPQSTYPVGDGPGLLFVSDLDGDGDNDIAVPNGNSGNVSVLKNNGSGTFAAAIDYAAGTRPNSIRATDLDKDGDLDLGVSNAISNDVSILRNSGSGVFTPTGTYPVSSWPSELDAADLDADGEVDLATSNMADSISLLKNNGDASFSAAIYTEMAGQTAGIRITDIDNDGDNDLVGAYAYSDTIIILKNSGNGTFGGLLGWSLVGDEPVSIAAADLDGDGDNDLAVANYWSDNVCVLINDGAGSIVRSDYINAGDGPQGITAADLDGDGDIDVAVANKFSDNLCIFRNNGNGTFAPAAYYGAGDEPRGICAADLDGDGDNDLVVSNYNSDNISILLNQGGYLVQNTNNVGTSSFRWAIEQSNTYAGIDTIMFGVSGIISPVPPLPALIDDSTVILGSTAPGGLGSVVLDGSSISGGGDGLVVQSRDNTIEGLMIRNFPGNGITVGGPLSIRNKLTRNRIYNDSGLAIDLGADGVTANDIGDGDTGPNDLVNYPKIDSAISHVDGSFTIYGSAPSSAIVEAYLAHPADDATRPADPSGHGEAYLYIGSTVAAGAGNFNMTIPAWVGHFSTISTTGIDPAGNTSEFGENFVLIPAPLMIVAYSPVNIIVTDPLMRQFGRDSLGNPITGIPDGEYYEAPNDSVVIAKPIQGDYIFSFVTEAGTPMGSTFSAIIQIDGSQQVSIIADQGVPSSGRITSVGYTVEEGCIYKNGDANGDEGVNVGDAVFVISYVFKGGMAPDPVLAGDANCDAATNVGDAVYIISYVFKGGEAPCQMEP